MVWECMVWCMAWCVVVCGDVTHSRMYVSSVEHAYMMLMVIVLMRWEW